jgi:hypothetical protein
VRVSSLCFGLRFARHTGVDGSARRFPIIADQDPGFSERILKLSGLKIIAISLKLSKQNTQLLIYSGVVNEIS